MKVVICYKLVPDVSGIKVKSDRTLDLSACEWSISQYDLNATEAANRLVEANEGSTLIALTFGGDITENSKLRKAILARGPHELTVVKNDDAGSADTFATAKILAEAIKKLGDVDVVVFGEGSGDMYVQQTGNMVGAILGRNTVNSVNSLSMSGEKLLVGRLVEEYTVRSGPAMTSAPLSRTSPTPTASSPPFRPTERRSSAMQTMRITSTP